jgi:hypothetical protein
MEGAMKMSEVPQDRGMIVDDNLKEICYAVDDDGSIVLAKSAGWDPKNVANDQAWELIKEQVLETVEKIKAGKRSPLAYHMVRHQMGLGLLAEYVGYNRLRVWCHLKPTGFKRLKPDQLKRYADVLNMDVADLSMVPGIEG